MTRVLVIDDHPIVLEGVQRVLEDAGIQEVVIVSNPVDGVRAYRSKKPDYIFVDLAMKSGVLVGLSFIRRLRVHDQRTPIIVLSMHEDPVIASQALRLGANGFVLKDTSSSDIITALQAARQGMPFLSHRIASSIALLETRGRSNPLHAMTLRELQTLELLAKGKPYGEIADELHVSYKTVANTTSQIKSKLGVKSLPEVMRIAIDNLPAVAGRLPVERKTAS